MRAYGLQCSAFSYVVSAQSTSKSFEQIQRWHHLEFLQQQQGSWKAGGRSASKWDEVLWRTRRQLKSCQTDSDLLLFMVLFSIIPIFWPGASILFDIMSSQSLATYLWANLEHCVIVKHHETTDSERIVRLSRWKPSLAPLECDDMFARCAFILSIYDRQSSIHVRLDG